MLKKLWYALEMAGMVLALTFTIGGIAVLALLVFMLVVNLFR